LLGSSAHLPSVLLLIRQRRVAASSSLGTGLSTAGNGLSTTIKYLRRKRNGAPGNDLGTTAKYL
jgi:hypothetical protein